MADEPKPRAITFKQVESAVGDGATRVWERIGEISGAGHIPRNNEGNASIDLTGVSEAKQAQIDRLLANKAEEEEGPKGKK